MKKLLIIAFLLFSISGCAFIQDQKANFEACMADQQCREDAENWQEKSEAISTLVASAVPVPGAAAAPKVIGYIALGLAAILGGRSLRKKKEENV